MPSPRDPNAPPKKTRRRPEVMPIQDTGRQPSKDRAIDAPKVWTADDQTATWLHVGEMGLDDRWCVVEMLDEA